MDAPQTQTFTPNIDDAFRRLDRVMATGIREITFASLAKGQVDPQVAQDAADRMVRSAAEAYKKVLQDGRSQQDTAQTLARILAELTVSSTSIWVLAQHTAITSMAEKKEQGK